MVARYFMCQRKISNLIYYFFGLLLPDGCKLSVILTFYMYENNELFFLHVNIT